VPERALKRYLKSLYEDHTSGEAAIEVSGYGALQDLLNTVGEELNPRIRVVLNPQTHREPRFVGAQKRPGQKPRPLCVAGLRFR
jgi:hypothetical protein